MSTPRRETALVGLLALLVGLALFGRSAWGGYFVADGTVMRDTYHVSTILETYARHLSRGHLPLWLPEFASGAPAPATWIYGLLSPGIALWALLPAGAAWTWSAVLHLALLAAGLHAYLRARGVGSAAAVAGALLATFSGYTLGRATAGHLNLVWPLAWTPWVLLGIRRVTEGLPGGVPGLALAAALGLVSGHVQAWFFLGPACVLVALLEARERRDIRALWRLAAAASLVVLLTAFQWLPTLEYASVAARAEMDLQYRVGWSTAPSVLAEAIAPGAFGVRPWSRWAPGDYENESALAGGLALLFLATAGARRGRLRWLVLAAGGMFLALGEHVAVVRFLHTLPPLSWARVPGRALVLPSLALPVLAAYGIDDLLGRDPVTRRRAWRRGLVATASTAGAAIVVLRISAARFDLPAGRAATLADAWSRTATPALLYSAAGLAVVLAALVAAARVPRFRAAVPAAALLAALLVAPRVASVPDTFYRECGAQTVPPDRRDHRVMLANQRLPFPERGGVGTLRPLSHVGTRWMHAAATDLGPAMARWFAVGGGLAVDGLPPGPPVDLARHVTFRPVPGALPERARVYAGTARVGVTPESGQQVLAALRSGRDALWVHDVGGTTDVATAALERVPDAQAAIQPSDDPSEIVVQVDTPVAGMLFVSESYFPGWERDDGTPVLRANVNFRAVPVGPGRSRVVLRYRPWTFRVGCGLAAAGLVAVLWLLAVRRRRDGPPTEPGGRVDPRSTRRGNLDEAGAPCPPRGRRPVARGARPGDAPRGPTAGPGREAG